jgi:hypothetical protein
MSERRVPVGVAFWHSRREAPRAKSMFQRFVQKQQRIWHIEVAFPPSLLHVGHPMKRDLAGRDFLVAYGIFSKNKDGTIGTVFETPRVFTADNYEWKFLLVPESRAAHAMRFAQKQVGKEYDPWGHAKVVFHPDSVHENSKKWICSTLTAAILSQLTDTMRGVNPGTVAMDDVWHLLDNEIEMTNMMSPKQRSTLASTGHIYSAGRV